MSTELFLATAADNIAILECQAYSIVKQYDPFHLNVSGIAWNHDNLRLASTCEKSPHISLAQVKGSSVVCTDLTTDQPQTVGRKCVAFNSKSSRYVISGASDNVVYIHDLKSQNLRKSYATHKSAVTSVLLNVDDAYVASGDEGGKIIVHSVNTGLSSKPLVTDKLQAIRQVQYSPFRKATIASVSNDGALNLWDTNTRRLLHSFTKGHQAPAMGLVMSPVNDTLIVTVGLDKRISFYDSAQKRELKSKVEMSGEHCFGGGIRDNVTKGHQSPAMGLVMGLSPVNDTLIVTVGLDKRISFYDSAQKRILNSLQTSMPLTSVDMLCDGHTLAVGTSRGNVLIHDLRMGEKQHMSTLTLHHSSVSALKFQKPTPFSSASTSSSSFCTPQSTTTTRSVMSSQERDSRSMNNNNAVDVFSPMRDDISSPCVDNSLTPPDVAALRQIDGVISPLQGVISPLHADFDSSTSINESASASYLAPPTNHIASYNHLTNDTSCNMTNDIPSYNQTTTPHSTNTMPSFKDVTKEISFDNLPPEDNVGLSPLVTDCVVMATGKGTVTRNNFIPDKTNISQELSKVSISPTSTHQHQNVSNTSPDPLSQNTPQSRLLQNHQNVPNSIQDTLSNNTPQSHRKIMSSSNDANVMDNIALLIANGVPTDNTSQSSVQSTNSTTNHPSNQPIVPTHLRNGDVSLPNDTTEQQQNSGPVHLVNDTSSDLVGATAAPPTAHALQEGLIRSIVEDSIDELREDCHNDYLSLLSTMLTLYHDQNAKFESMMNHHHSLYSDLMTENELLRAEVERLSHTF